MNKDNVVVLMKERNSLVNQWMHATSENEKVQILVKLIDIDEKLESLKRQGKAHKRAAG